MLALWTLLVSLLYFSLLLHADNSMVSLIVDDTDGSIRYSAGAWKPESVSDTYIRRAMCLHETYTAAHRARTLDGIFLEVPFVGTSITLFIVTLPTCPVNTSITLDDEAPAIHSFHQTEATYNVQLYSSAPLPFDNHTITFNLPDSVNGANNTSCLFFDYAVVHDTPDGVSSSTTSTEGTSTSTPIYGQISGRGFNSASLGGILGGVLAFFVLIVVILSFWIRRRLSAFARLPEKSGTESQSIQITSVGSQASTLVQNSSPVSSPPTSPRAASSSQAGPRTRPSTLLPGHNVRPNTTSAGPLLSTSLSLQASESTFMADKRIQPPDPAIRIDARSFGSKVVFNFAPRH